MPFVPNLCLLFWTRRVTDARQSSSDLKEADTEDAGSDAKDSDADAKDAEEAGDSGRGRSCSKIVMKVNVVGLSRYHG